MSLAVRYSRALAGVAVPPVTVEVDLANGLPSFTIVSLPEAKVKESKDRVRAALQNARFDFPTRRITVNLAPADLPKESGCFDLPIALGILAASGQIPADKLKDYEFAGELALTGDLRPVRGALAMTLGASRDGRSFMLPAENAPKAALVGGGSNPRPGEMSMAMHGVSFLDELPELARKVLEVLRELLESGRIIVSRAARQAEFGARFILVGAMNACPCGYLGHPNGKCRCTPNQVARYRSRISSPLLDRIHLQIEMPALPQEDLTRQRQAQSDSSPAVRERVAIARERATARQEKPNARLDTREIDKHCVPDNEGETLLKQAISRMGLSARAYHRILRVARTVADLAAADHIAAAHIAEAIQYRRFDRAAM